MLGSQTTRNVENQSSKRLQQASEYVSRNWFPPNPSTLDLIKNKLNRGDYRANQRELLKDLRRDFALFSHVLKASQSIRKLTTLNPFDIIETLTDNNLKTILNVSVDDISTHSISAIEKTQASRMKHLVLTTATADLLAANRSLDNNTVFFTALVRQLGLNLIAWNYPSVYVRALSTLRNSDKSLEQVLEDSLQFQPVLLGWDALFGAPVPEEAQTTLGLLTDEVTSSTLKDEISEICEMGEAFAVINDPESYPAGNKRSLTIIEDLQGILGPKGIEQIVNRAKENFSDYMQLTPDLFKGELPYLSNVNKVADQRGNLLLSKNLHVARCSEEFQAAFRKVYRLITPGEISPKALEHIVLDLVPTCDFTSGCLFLLDPNSQVLRPKLHFGGQDRESYGDVSLDQTHSIFIEAFYCSYPLRHERVFIRGEQRSFIVALIGSGSKTGVLILNYPPFSDRVSSDERLILFKAIRHCLSDALQFNQII